MIQHATVPTTMKAMVTAGHGGMEMLEWHTEWPVPVPGPHEVLVRVGACGLNNTDVNTRVGWYAKSVTSATGEPTTAPSGSEDADRDAAEDVVVVVDDDDQAPSWGGQPIEFPRIQGADVCGEIVAVGDRVDPGRIGERVISDNWIRDPDRPNDTTRAGYLGSERNGGFAEYTTLPSRNALTVRSELSDAELATFSCSYATAEGMLTRAEVTDDDTVLITGASGGVGGALVQLARLRGARVIAMASASKHQDLAAFGPEIIIDRQPDDLRAAIDAERVTVVADIVGGDYWPNLIDILERGGRYVTSGAIAGPLVPLDLRTLYLTDLSLFGSTVTAPETMATIVSLIERGRLTPILAATYPLAELARAQQAFIDKRHVGNIVVVP